MHEASLAQGLLKIALASLEEHAQKNPGGKALKIKEIVCDAGLFAGFEDSTLRACLELFAEGTPCEDAILTINTLPLDCRCQTCGKGFQAEKRRFSCPHCGGEEVDFSGGRGLTLKAINVDTED